MSDVIPSWNSRCMGYDTSTMIFHILIASFFVGIFTNFIYGMVEFICLFILFGSMGAGENWRNTK